MPYTQIDDVIVPETWRQYMIERTAETDALMNAGIAVTDDELNEIAKGGGSVANMPHWNDLSGNSEAQSDDPSSPLTPAKITGTNEKTVKHFKARAWEVTDLAAVMAGDDPMRVLGDRLVPWWNRDIQNNTLVPTLQGLFNDSDAPLYATHRNVVGIADGNNATDANLIGPDNVIDTANLLGDAWERITGMVMHSKPFARLQKLNLIEFRPLAEQSIEVPYFLGRRVIVSDACPSAAGGTSGFLYDTYLFGAGTIARGEGAPKVPLENDRDSLGSADILVSRRDFIMHPRGVSYTGSVAGTTPTANELKDGGNWTLVYEAKNVPILMLRTNG